MLSNSDYEQNLTKCDKCQIIFPKNKYRNHERTNLHKSNCLLRTEFKNIQIIATAFKNRITTFRLNAMHNFLTPEAFFCDNLSETAKLIKISLRKHKCIKVNFELFAYFTLPNSAQQQIKSFNTKYNVILESTNLKEWCMDMAGVLKEKFSEYEQSQSGWSFNSISHLEINIIKYCPMRSGTYLPLPQAIKITKGCLNIQNSDNYCFLWSIVAALYPAKTNVCRTSSYPHYSEVLSTKEMSFPLSYNDIKHFEKK